jgi:fructose-bisphosphate aldolase class 1
MSPIAGNMQGNSFISKYADELCATARAMCADGKGLLAADESTSTIAKRVSICAMNKGDRQ